ncbi:hypothetical protein ACKFKF_04610 [Phormidesmis sp. 146-12]
MVNDSQRLTYKHTHVRLKGYNVVYMIDQNRVSDFNDRLMLTMGELENFY